MQYRDVLLQFMISFSVGDFDKIYTYIFPNATYVMSAVIKYCIMLGRWIDGWK